MDRHELSLLSAKGYDMMYIDYLPVLFLQMSNEDSVNKEKKCNEVPECFKYSLTQLFAVSTLFTIFDCASYYRFEFFQLFYSTVHRKWIAL